MGELLKQFDAQGRRSDQQPLDGAVQKLSQDEVAARAGISERQAKTAVRVANAPEEQFVAAIDRKARDRHRYASSFLSRASLNSDLGRPAGPPLWVSIQLLRGEPLGLPVREYSRRRCTGSLSFMCSNKMVAIAERGCTALAA